MNDNPLRSIVIAGGGVSGWVAAAATAHELRDLPVTIRVVEDPDAPPSGLATPALPLTQAFHRFLGIEAPAVIRATGGTFRLGTRFIDWGAPGMDEIHPVGAHGASIEYLPFHQFATRMRLAGDPTPYGAYCLPAAAARAGRFAPPASDPGSILSTMAYSLNLDLDRYARIMREYAVGRGVQVVAGRVASVALKGEDGFIESLSLADGGGVQGDLFIDCTGEGSVLLGNALGVDYEDWGDLLPGDRLAVLRVSAGKDRPSCSTVRARDEGWTHVVPLQGADHEVFVYDSRLTSDEQAASLWPADHRDDVAFRPIRPGRRRVFWKRNCVALGLAAGAFQPLDGTGLSTVHNGIMRLMGLLPLRDCDPLLAEEYNRLTELEYQNIRDFQALHYRLAGRAGQGFWRLAADDALPGTLDHRMRLFRVHGQVALHEEETFSEANWAAAWIGHGAWPEGYDPVLDSYDFARLKQRFKTMRELIRDAVPRMPSHASFIAANRLTAPA